MATRLPSFAPDWASPPGETLRDAMFDRGMTVGQLASATELPIVDLERLLVGDEQITLAVAQRLASAVGATAQFWVNREYQYREDLARSDLNHWVHQLPIKEMTRLGWIPKSHSAHELARLCLDFFQVPDVDSWKQQRRLLESARYRSSRSLPLDDDAVLAWLQESQRRAHRSGPVAVWNRSMLRRVMERVRPLTLDKDPRSFLPQLQAALARAGVRLVVLQAPHGCPISGASLLLEDGTALIALTARFLSDDHLWFTLYHEAGHLLLHDDSQIFVDDLAAGDSTDQQEREADEYAATSLVPSSLLDELPRERKPTSRQIIRACVRHKVAPGVVVGHLQHEGALGFANLNSLKRRYRWAGPTLERG